MKVVVKDLPQQYHQIEIIPFGDIHKGDTHIDERSLILARNYVLEKDNRFIIVNGDVINLALKFSKSDSYGESMSPMAQIESICKYLAPMKERILIILPGNHEERLYKETGVDAGKLIAAELGLKDIYARESGLVFVSFGYSERNVRQRLENRTIKLTYSIYCHHGHGGGRTVGSKMNKVISLDGIIDADLYIM